MRPFFVLTLLLIFSVVLAACSSTTPAAQVIEEIQPPAAVISEATPTPTTTTTPYPPATLNTDYEDAASLRNQLAYGTLKLEGSDQAITLEQAKVLLPLWQAIVALSGNETTATEELTAVQNQIIEGLTPAQLEAIVIKRITNTDLNAFYAEHGITFPTPEPGVTKVPGSGKNRSQEDKEATRAAAAALGTSGEMGSGTGQTARTLLFTAVVELLTNRAKQ